MSINEKLNLMLSEMETCYKQILLLLEQQDTHVEINKLLEQITLLQSEVTVSMAQSNIEQKEHFELRFKHLSELQTSVRTAVLGMKEKLKSEIEKLAIIKQNKNPYNQNSYANPIFFDNQT
ncbi:hypothetical protein [Effusibacillus lacus]|uniref:hypothetical protein n=1 Tax=Effusibacillus lacus TaxID=1348429 RepID=UPI000BB9482D|nr:hypothetical protein [Effusibacillus lacus]TCS69823.1 hypothetical protein EDD64_13555 [Effusibacillus lacus]